MKKIRIIQADYGNEEDASAIVMLMKAYTLFGFMPYELDPKMGTARFLQKVIP